MANMTVLQIAQEFCRRQALPNPSSVVAAQDDTTRQVHGLLNEGIMDLSTRYNWQEQTNDYTFSHANGAGYLALSLSTLPDFHALISHTLFDTVNGLEVTGPLNEQEWASLMNTGVASANYQYRLKHGGLYIYGVPAVPLANPFTFSYLSQYAVYNPDTAQAEEYYTSDSSYPKLPARIILADIKWRWKANKGLPYAEDMRISEMMILDHIGREPNADLVLDGDEFNMAGGPNLLVAAGSWPL
jgi:hypothetical protein